MAGCRYVIGGTVKKHKKAASGSHDIKTHPHAFLTPVWLF